MKYKAPGKCPVCSEKLEISKLTCKKCKTKIEGEFIPCEFCNLDSDQLRFLKAFVGCRGNIKDVEKELGISYPTVRRRLDDLLSALGLEATPGPAAEKRTEVFEQLRKGEISVDDAVDALGE